MAAGREVAPLALLPAVLARLKESLSDDGWRARVAARLVASVGEGTVRGIDEDGALLVETPDGEMVRRDR